MLIMDLIYHCKYQQNLNQLYKYHKINKANKNKMKIASASVSSTGIY